MDRLIMLRNPHVKSCKHAITQPGQVSQALQNRNRVGLTINALGPPASVSGRAMHFEHTRLERATEADGGIDKDHGSWDISQGGISKRKCVRALSTLE